MARKITIDSVCAFINDEEFKRENMEVNTNGDVTYLRLFGNTIATKTKDGRLYIDSCGWFTNTTKERLNHLLYTYGSTLKISQKNVEWYLGDEAWNGNKTYIKKNN